MPVIFEDSLPVVAETRQTFEPKHSMCMPCERIPEWFKEKGFVDIRLEGNKDLVHLHMEEGKTQTYLFFNISAAHPIDAVTEFPYTGEYVVYDAWDNSCIRRKTADGKIRLRIPARGTLLLIFGSELEQNCPGILPAELDDLTWSSIAGDTRVRMTMKDAEEAHWQEPVMLRAYELGNLAGKYPTFAGLVKYEMTVTSEKKAGYIDLGTVGELAEVTVNGASCGQLVAPPFRFRVAEAWKDGENTVEILIATNCGYRKKNPDSKSMALNPMGLLGPVKLA